MRRAKDARWTARIATVTAVGVLVLAVLAHAEKLPPQCTNPTYLGDVEIQQVCDLWRAYNEAVSDFDSAIKATNRAQGHAYIEPPPAPEPHKEP